MKEYKNVFVFDHPLIKHKVAILRDKNTRMKEFRELVEEITALMTYESMRDLALIQTEVETPICKTTQCKVPEESVVIVPILRAGLGMVNGVHKIFPTAIVGHIGMYRNEETLEPQEYYCNLPYGIENKTVYLIDPMLATGGSACDAISALKGRGCNKIKFMSIIAAPEGVDKVAKAHPDVQVYVSTLDVTLNEHGYIVPGLGDAGDRLFGTK
ncbi:MAG: uracil phosphoribosyltransferase [Clostridia bacterium]|nr:uracil phosphoribosyltransferase [Clostridia bacterium]MDE7328510.1 uracil phosphoribosyltransferase [Clostridia bacterium]